MLDSARILMERACLREWKTRPNCRRSRKPCCAKAIPTVRFAKFSVEIYFGADHVGLGSDFDGASMPEGMEDASKLPKITEALLRKGYSDGEIRKILGGNLLRVMEQNEKVSRELKAQ